MELAMNRISRVLLLLLIVFLFALLLLSQSPTTSARLLPTNQGDEDVNSDSSIKTPDDSLYNALLMGLDECDKKDESCLKRRMVEEVHLDYIYTQHHKP